MTDTGQTDALETAREMFAAIAYVHDRLGLIVAGKPVRDLDEALAAYATMAKAHTRALAASLSRETALVEALNLAKNRIVYYG